MTRRLTIIESPLSPKNGRTMDENLSYLRLCLRDSWNRGELPFASHGFFPFFLNEHDPLERQAGIEAGYEFWEFRTVDEGSYGEPDIADDLPRIVFYLDHGMSDGMHAAFTRITELNRDYESRYILALPETSATEQGTSQCDSPSTK